MRFPAKKSSDCPKAPRDSPSSIGLPWDSPPPSPESVRTYGRMLTHGAPLARAPLSRSLHGQESHFRMLNVSSFTQTPYSKRTV